MSPKNPVSNFISADEEMLAFLSNLGQKWCVNVLLLYGGKAVFKNGAYAQLAEALTQRGIAFPELGGVRPNPRIDKVREAVARIRASGVDAIVPLGGGSVFDSAKAVAERSEERRVGKECRSRWSPYH